jgi:hypothetical protein
MTRLELQTLFYQLVNDPSGTFFNATNFVQPSLNRSLIEVQKRLIMSGDLYYVRSPPSTALTVQYQQDYVLPDDCLKLHRVTIDTDTATPQPAFQVMLPITLNQIDRYGNDTGTPQAWMLTKNKISLYPIPDTANKIIRLWYSNQVDEMTSDSSTPDCPEIYHEMICLLSVIDAQIKDETILTNINYKLSRYDEHMKQMADQRNYQTTRTIRSYDDDFWTCY